MHVGAVARSAGVDNAPELSSVCIHALHNVLDAGLAVL